MDRFCERRFEESRCDRQLMSEQRYQEKMSYCTDAQQNRINYIAYILKQPLDEHLKDTILLLRLRSVLSSWEKEKVTPKLTNDYVVIKKKMNSAFELNKVKDGTFFIGLKIHENN